MNNWISHRAVILPEWVDYNGHLSEAYYVLIFGHATDRFLDVVGMNDAYRREKGCSVYSMEAHLHYWQEIAVHQNVEIASQILKRDSKRVLLHHTMLHEKNPMAAIELTLLHVTKDPLKASPFQDEVAQRIEQLWAAQQSWPQPKGRSREMRW
jgi:acyl-CoA thioester hydrolase